MKTFFHVFNKGQLLRAALSLSKLFLTQCSKYIPSHLFSSLASISIHLLLRKPSLDVNKNERYSKAGDCSFSNDLIQSSFVPLLQQYEYFVTKRQTSKFSALSYCTCEFMKYEHAPYKKSLRAF